MERIIRKTDIAYKYGCERCIQGEDALEISGTEIKRWGNHPYIIGGEISMPIVKERLLSSIEKEGIEYEIEIYENPCSHENAYEIVHGEKFEKCDVIVGVGGGRLMDFAKLLKEYSGKPVILIPTSSATCAAYTPLSVCYNNDGTTVGSTKFMTEISALIMDMKVLSSQPVRLLTAGAYDAMAKLVELKHRVNSSYSREDYIGMRLSFLVAEFIYKTIKNELKKAQDDVKNKTNSREVEDIVYVSIVGAGLCSGLVNGSNQCAIGHKFYEFTRTFLQKECKKYLHGELVAVGLIAQLYYNGEETEAMKFKEEMKAIGFATTLSAMGVTVTEELFNKYYDALLVSSALKGYSQEKCERAKESLRKIIC